MLTNRFCGPITAAAMVVAGLALCQETEEMDARDMFYSASDLLRKPKAAAKKKDAAPRPAPRRAEHYFQAAAHNERPLGLRYSLLKQTGGRLMETTPGATYRSGDLIRLSVMANQKAYVYVVARSSKGEWSALFPSSKSTQSSNELVAGRTYQIPGGPREYFEFDNEPGEERVFILLSRKPLADVEDLIRGLASGEGRPVPMVQADNRLKQEFAPEENGDLARALVFTRVDEPPPATDEPGEKAIYVVNGDTAKGDRVLADIVLEHR